MALPPWNKNSALEVPTRNSLPMRPAVPSGWRARAQHIHPKLARPLVSSHQGAPEVSLMGPRALTSSPGPNPLALWGTMPAASGERYVGGRGRPTINLNPAIQHRRRILRPRNTWSECQDRTFPHPRRPNHGVPLATAEACSRHGGGPCAARGAESPCPRRPRPVHEASGPRGPFVLRRQRGQPGA